VAQQEDTPHETPQSKSELRSETFSADDFTTMGESDRELLLHWLRQIEQNLQHQIDLLWQQLREAQVDQMRHLESHVWPSKPSSYGPSNGEVVFKGRNWSARGKAIWITLVLLLITLAGLAWRVPIGP
jgi:hypothetical protein